MANETFTFKKILHHYMMPILLLILALCVMASIVSLWMHSDVLEYQQTISQNEMLHQQVMAGHEQVSSVADTEKVRLIALQSCLNAAADNNERRLCDVAPEDRTELLKEHNKIQVFNTCIQHSQSVHERTYCHQVFGTHAVGLDQDGHNHITLLDLGGKNAANSR